MNRKNFSGLIQALLLLGMLALTFNIQQTESLEPSSTKLSAPSQVTPWGDWEHYHNYTEIVDTLLYLNDTYPNIVDVFSIGKSWENRDIHCIRLTNENKMNEKPKVFFVGYHHARELISAELPLYFSVDAATNYGTEANLTQMIDNTEIYIVVALNVDGFDVVEDNEWQRKNAHPSDEDEDGLHDEDPPDDEDGDGFIEDLLWWNGAYWEFVQWEGVDDDGDGLLNEDMVGGVDLNRNYGYEWNTSVDSGSPYPSDEDYRGSSPFSEPETQALRDFALQHDFKYAISFHSGADIILYPWGYTTNPTPHNQKFQEIASNMSVLVGSPYEQSSQMYTTSGVWDDWMYGNRSTLAFTCEIYANTSAWQYEPGPNQNSWWEKGVFQFFNPNPNDIETVIQKWLPIFTYIINESTTEAHDIAITKVTPRKTVVGQGFSTNMNVTMVNQGDFTNNFNVTVYANTTIIDTLLNITLTSGNSTTITFTWNTTNWAKGNYTISAHAWPTPNETDITDNTVLADRKVCITIPGDVDADSNVGLDDAFKLLAHYGARESDLNYDPNLDITDNGQIFLYDAVILLSHYGQNG